MADGSITISTEIDNSGIESGLRETQTGARRAARSVEDLSESFEDFADDADDALEEAGDGLGDLSETITNIGSAIVGAFSLDAIAGFATGIVEESEELNLALSKLETHGESLGMATQTIRDNFTQLATVSGDTGTAVEALSNLLAAGVPENQLQWAVEGLSNAVTMFPDTLSIEGLADGLQETLATGEATGQFGELLDRLGIGAANFSARMAEAGGSAGQLEISLNALTSGSLSGLNDKWKENNASLVEGREASLRLETAMADLALQIEPVITFFTNLKAAIVEWVSNNVDVEQFFEVVTAGIAAFVAAKAVETISGLGTVIGKFGTFLASANGKAVLFAAAIGAIVYVASEIGKVWDDMSGMEKAVIVLGAVAAAAFTAAIAVGAFQSAATLGIAAAAIALGVGAVLVAVNNAKKRAESASGSVGGSPAGGTFPRATAARSIMDYSVDTDAIPQLATGAVIPPNKRFMAVLGDQKNGTNLEAPESLIRQIVREETGGDGGAVNVSVRFDGSLSGLARYLAPKIEAQRTLHGVDLVK